MIQPNYIQLEDGDERLAVSTATHDPDIACEVAGDLPEKGTAINMMKSSSQRICRPIGRR